NTSRIRELFKKISKELVHDGDMFGIVSSGPSSLSIDMTYDKTRLDEAIKKITGDELKPADIINGPSGAEGPSEVRYRAHVAFSTVNELLKNLESVHNRRKALVYVSDGYDFVPFSNARLGLMDPNSPFAQNESRRMVNQNDFGKALKRIDAETSDYYVLGYYSKNPDRMKRRRQVEVKVVRAGMSVWARKEYVLKPPPAPVSSSKQ